ncbi:26S proteasome non-ATPase regulatory subunit 9-like isoform X2 [Xenia sp. Carnegie-2017]|nr:26S proteasome non-ATPase regulatory subunit 9-like isoform X2 [Xenia sp. Carnegie-2017]
MSGKLVDNDDYPRQDIDVYAVRFARNRIICLQNDHKALMKLIEDGIHDVHTAARNKRDSENSSQQTSSEQIQDLQMAFLQVNELSPLSPAENAGLRVGDEIIRFGSLNIENFDNMQSVANVVQHSMGQSIPIIIRRGEHIHHLNLIPNIWHGRGLLGCNIAPIHKR